MSQNTMVFHNSVWNRIAPMVRSVPKEVRRYQPAGCGKSFTYVAITTTDNDARFAILSASWVVGRSGERR